MSMPRRPVHPLPYQKTLIVIGFVGFVIAMSVIVCGCAERHGGRERMSLSADTVNSLGVI